MSYSKGIILLVDDDPAILLSVGDQLQFSGYEVVKASTAEQALDKMKTQTPDLIILDISMPGIGGMGFLKAISETAGTIKYPVLVFTARGELDDFFTHLGVEGFLPKIVDPEKLLKEVDRIISKHFIAPPETANGVTKHRVLLAEDDKDVRDDLLRFLEHHGHQAWGVGSGLAILEAVFMHHPTVVMLKFILPHMNGPTIAQMLAGMPSTQNIPVILYDDSGIHPPSATFPHVHAFVPAADGKSLLKALVDTAGGRSA
jgi:CheY-like chemotaxis protein